MTTPEQLAEQVRDEIKSAQERARCLGCGERTIRLGTSKRPYCTSLGCKDPLANARAAETAFASEPKQPEPERCNATWSDPESRGRSRQCGMAAGHDCAHAHSLGGVWDDDTKCGIAKPHEPVREEPKAEKPLWVTTLLRERDTAQRIADDAIAQAVAITKERDEALTLIELKCAAEKEQADKLLGVLAEHQKYRSFAESWAQRLEEILLRRGIRNEVLGEIGPCTPYWPKADYVPQRVFLERVKALTDAIAELERIRQRTFALWSLIELGENVEANQREHMNLARRRAHLLEVCGVRS